MRSWLLLAVLAVPALQAETLDFRQATERALASDPRVTEQRHLVEAARALLAQAQGSDSLIFDVNLFLSVAPTYDGGLFAGGATTCATPPCALRDDVYSPDGFTPWTNLTFKVIKPLYTFGKIEHYAAAARGNVEVRQGEVRLSQQQTRLDVARAYFGFLAARDSRYLLEDVQRQVKQATAIAKAQFEDGEAKQSDLFALQAGGALIEKYLAQATALEGVALDGLRVLTGVGLGQPLEVADSRLEPLPLPPGTLDELTARALRDRPEMQQLEAGLKARRALVEAKRADTRPNLYAGVAGMLSHAPGREALDNPYLYDPFNTLAAAPVIGLKWDYQGGAQQAKIAEAQAELDALVAKGELARTGIPYQVAEAWHQVQGHRKMVNAMAEGSRAGRRWMIAAYTDYEAGLEETAKLVEAFKSYVLAHADYLLTTNEYNLHVIKLQLAIGGEP